MPGRRRRGGLLLSEFHPKQPPQKWTYVQRNRSIAGLVGTLIVTEAPLRSGALISANNALNFGRDVYAVPSHPYHNQGLGTLKLLQDGALFATQPSDIIEGCTSAPTIPILQTLQHPQTIEELRHHSSLSTRQLVQQLYELQAKGLIQQQGPYWQSTHVNSP